MYSKNYYRQCRKNYRGASPMPRVLTILAVIVVLAVVMFVGFKMFGAKVHETNETPDTKPETAKTVTAAITDVTPAPKTEQPETHIVAKEVTIDTTVESEPEEEVIPQIYEGEFELPLQGATVYTMANTKVCDEAGNSKAVNAGTALRIVSEEGEMLVVTTEDGFTGKIQSAECLLNLPDVIPSIVYRDTNSVSSVFQSSGYDIPNVTGEQFYNVEQYNERLGRTEFNMPVMFMTAKKVMAAQQMALSEGYSLCIVETYRPMDTQKKVCSNLKVLENSNSEVRNGIVGHGWTEDWFIAQSISNHQRGYALDLTLVEVKETEICTSGDYAYINVSDYAEVQMPTDIHELSDASAALAYAVTSKSATAWKDVPLASSMNDVAIRLQNYCVGAGFTPLASEWWHFNDLDARYSTTGSLSTGDYFLQANLSIIP